MGLLDRILALRITTEPKYVRVNQATEGSRTLAGVPMTPERAPQIPAVQACLRFLTQTTAVVSWHVFKNGKAGAEIQSANSIDWLLSKRASSEWSSFQFRETLLYWALLWGNGFAEIERDQAGRPFALWPIHPERVRVCRDEDDGLLYYEINNGTDGKVEVAAADMFHIRGFGHGPVGIGVVEYATQTLGWARAAQLFGASFYGNGANISGVVINKKPLKEGGLKRQKAEFEQLYKGPRNGNKTAFLDNDADWKPIGVDAQKSQFVEIHQHLVEEICRLFGVPPHKVQHLLRATFTNIESQAIEVVVDSIIPWVKRFEDEADYKLFGQNRQGLYTKMNVNALMRGDSAARIAFYKGMRDIGAYSVNHILELEDENTIGPDGDKHTMQSGFTTLEKIGEDPPAPVAAPALAPVKEDPPVDDTAKAYAPWVSEIIDSADEADAMQALELMMEPENV